MRLMKLQSLSVVFFIVASSCSSPKYFTDFNNYRFSVEKKKPAVAQAEMVAIDVDPTQLTASTRSVPALFLQSSNAEVAKPVASISRAEKKELRNEFRKEIKRAVREAKKLEPSATQAAQGWDRDLKLAAIFGAIGFALGALFGVSEILAFAGAVCIVIALVFLIKWLIRQ